MSTDYTGHHEPTPYVPEPDFGYDIDPKPAPGSDPYSGEAQAALASSSQLTDKQVDAVLAETSYGYLAADGPSVGWVKPWVPPVGEATRLARRPEVAGPTPAEDEAWAAVEAAAAAHEDAVEVVGLLQADQTDETKRQDRDAVDAVRAGKAIPKAKATDWEAEGRRRRAVAEVALEELRSARRDFDRVSREEAPKRRGLAVDRMRDAKARAVELAPEFLAAFSAWRAAVADLRAVVVAEDKTGDAELFSGDRCATSDVREMLRLVRSAPAAIRAVLASENPVVDGTYFAAFPDRERVPLFARPGIAENGDGGLVHLLAEVETDEGFKRTSFVRAYAQRFIRPRD